MASLYKKVISGRPYWYLREMGWVDGKPKLVSERYLGTAAEIEALLDAREVAVVPDRARHLAFGAVAAVWGLLADLDLAGLIDQHVPAVSGLPLTPGTYLALAVLTGSWTRVPSAGSRTGGRPPPRTGSRRSAPRRWTIAGSGTPCTPSPPTP